jgi:hypothetical protein
MINGATHLGTFGLTLILKNICALLGNLTYEKPNNNLKKEVQVSAFSEQDEWENSRCMLNVRPICLLRKGK